MFKDIFGESPQTKILDFLADMPDFDYTITELANKSNVSKPTIYKILPSLLKKKLLIETRMMGNSHLYALNIKNPIVKMILKLDFEIASKIAELEDNKQIKDIGHILVT